jgi:hypothetical protein
VDVLGLANELEGGWSHSLPFVPGANPNDRTNNVSSFCLLYRHYAKTVLSSRKTRRFYCIVLCFSDTPCIFCDTHDEIQDSVEVRGLKVKILIIEDIRLHIRDDTNPGAFVSIWMCRLGVPLVVL